MKKALYSITIVGALCVSATSLLAESSFYERCTNGVCTKMHIIKKRKINKCSWVYTEKDIETKDPKFSFRDMSSEDAKRFKTSKKSIQIRNDETLNCCEGSTGTGYSESLYQAVCGR